MYKKIEIKQDKGFTLVEVLVILAIIGLVSSIAFPMLNMNSKFTSNQLNESNQRNEVRVVSTYLNNDIRYAKEVIVNTKKLEIKDNDNNIIKYYLKQNSNNQKYLVREEGNLNSFSGIKDVNFNLLNDKLVSVKLTTDIEDNKSIEFKITRLDFKLAREPGEEPEDSFYDYLLKNNVFLYSNNLFIKGSTSINKSKNNEGTIVIDNLDRSDLDFDGNNNINMKNIYINKLDNTVRFNNSTKLGMKGFTEAVNIKGDVILDNGGAEINSNHVSLDGNVTFEDSAKIDGKEININGNVLFKNGGAGITGDRIFINGNVTFGDSAKIYGKEIYINGNVKFNNWSAKIDADKIYIDGTVELYRNAPNIDGDLQYVDEIIIPDQIEMDLPSIPLLHADNWYVDREYKTSGSLVNGSKIFSNNYSFTGSGTYKDVIIVSKGDISLNNWMHVTGLLFAPNGKVTFSGASFEGVVIAKDGFYVTNGGSTITYRNISDYINNIEDFPLR